MPGLRRQEKIIAALTEPLAIRTTLDRVGLASGAPPLALLISGETK
jgi:hypothetical protein